MCRCTMRYVHMEDTGQEIATGHLTFFNNFKQMSDHFQLISCTQYITWPIKNH